MAQHLHLIAVDESASSILKVTPVTAGMKRTTTYGKPASVSMALKTKNIPVIVSVDVDENIINSIKRVSLKRENIIFIYPGSDEANRLTAELLNESVILIPAVVDTLKAVAISNSVSSLEKFISVQKSNEIVSEDFTIENFLKPGYYYTFFESDGKNIKEATVRFVRRYWEIGSATQIALMIETSQSKSLMDIVETIEVIESRTDIHTTLHYRTKHNSGLGSITRLTALTARYLPPGNSIQKMLEKESSYLVKLTIIAQEVYNNHITPNQAENLCFDNGLAYEDLNIIYKVIYSIPQSCALLIRKLKETKDDKPKQIEAIAYALIEGDIDISIIEELTLTYELNIDEVLEKTKILIEDTKESS